MLFATLPVSPVAARGVVYEGGLSVATGRYGGTDRTSTVTLFTGGAVAFGSVSVNASWPVFAQDGDVLVATGGGTVRSPGGGSGRGGRRSTEPSVTTNGDANLVLGDPVTRASWRAVDGVRTGLSLALSVKAPLANPERYGTGEWDFGASADVSRHLGGPYFGGVGIAWWRLGDPAEVDFQDPWIASLMLTRGDGRANSIHLSVSTPAVEGDDPPVTLGVSHVRALDHGGWGISASAGLTDTAADVAVALTWRVGPRF